MCSLCRLPVTKKTQFWANFDFFLGGGLLYRSPIADEGQIWCAIEDPWYALTCQISSRSVNSVALCWRKTPIFAVFGLWRLVLSPIGNSLTKLNMGTQLKTFPYPTASKSFLYSNAFMAKSGAHSLTFKSVTNKQTSRQTDRQTKNSTFLDTPAAGEIRAHQTWHGDRGPRVRSCTSKTFGGLTHSFAAKGR